MKDIINLDSVDKYNKLFGIETLHPLVSVVDLSEATRIPEDFTFNYGIYAVFLKQVKCGDIRYGKQVYDYQEGTVTSFAPGQVVSVTMDRSVRPAALGVLFHPDLIAGSSLGREIRRYTFFSYSSSEALHCWTIVCVFMRDSSTHVLRSTGIFWPDSRIFSRIISAADRRLKRGCLRSSISRTRYACLRIISGT